MFRKLTLVACLAIGPSPVFAGIVTNIFMTDVLDLQITDRSSDPNVALNPLSHTLSIPANGMIVDANFIYALDSNPEAILHAAIGDYVIMLTAPSGETVTLVDQPGTNAVLGQGIGASAGITSVTYSRDYAITIDDEHNLGAPSVLDQAEAMGVGIPAKADPWAVGEPGSPNPRDTFRPDPDQLSDLYSLPGGGTLDIHGDWTITIYDNFHGHTGQLAYWGLELTYDEGVIPEPASLGLVGIGALCLIHRRRRRG